MKKLFLPLIALLMVAGCQSKPVTGETVAAQVWRGDVERLAPGTRVRVTPSPTPVLVVE